MTLCMKLLAVLWVVFVASFAWGADNRVVSLPALYKVVGVVSDDSLNIRRAPNPSADRIASYAPNTPKVEIIAYSDDGKWGQVNAYGEAGWVSMAYLEPVDGAGWETLSNPMFCYGTEPFWDASIDLNGRSEINEMEAPNPSPLEITWLTPVWGNTEWDMPLNVALQVSASGDEGIAVIRAESCNDGMSDAEYGLSINMFLQSSADANMPGSQFSGCCTIAP